MISCNAQFIAGMPNLSLCGLSENWLLKECGNQHWFVLAKQFGETLPDFRAPDGSPVYAAFVAVKLDDARLQLINENDQFCIETRLIPIGRARFFSSHQLLCNGQTCARVEMLSTQVSRREAGNNQSVVRTELATETSTDSASDARLTLNAQAIRLADSAKAFRNEHWQEWLELRPDTCAKLPGIIHHPCPHNDFNGADFLYFANFQAAADRAEWSWNRNRQLWQIADRQLNYYGNINIGDALHLSFATLKSDERTLLHWLSVRRDSDGQKIADILTRKQRLNGAEYRWANRG
ncbi:Pnap_2097 family protein [Marinobacterium lutimaris]|uniref:Probable biosynthetic protein, Pnap_2097 family n=1 Tax=Marinobacterium lutimaris TaxID=568106 RepID=A0A1H5VJE0_9GAMM|nr:Pnap_2097 family protein [Marinobacterium lutimaris]SEF86667.1 probable biosynthetic protein, Pnap_2097 family [Marinobacterium lutimaris]